MSFKIEDVFNDEAISEHGNYDENTYWFSLKDIPTKITITLSKSKQSGYNFKLSHYIKTPKQIGAYHPSNPWGDDEAYALHRAIQTIALEYNIAVKNGHKPSIEWLVLSPNR